MRVTLLALAIFACSKPDARADPTPAPTSQPAKKDGHGMAAPAVVPEGHEVALLAGGCFWCMESSLEAVPGVTAVVSGYTAGHKKDPTYKEVGTGSTGHTEAVQVVFDPKTISYEKLLDAFWHNVDPFAKDRQFCDAGTQYRAGIYWLNEAQRKAAQASLNEVAAKFDKAITTELEQATEFYPAEEYHQDFYKKNPAHYQRYRYGCRRDARLKEIWGDAAGH